jgi:hypothetical protein
MADADDVQLTQSVQDSIMDSKYGADIAYYMAQNKDDAQRILSLPPKAADREIGRIESYIEQSLKSKPAVPPVSNAPKPVQPPRATSSGLTRDLEKMSPAEFASYRNEQIRKKKQR